MAIGIHNVLRQRLVLAAMLVLPGLTARAQEPDESPSLIEFEDDPLSQPEFRFSDVRTFRAWTKAEQLHIEVEMAEPIAAGVFTCVGSYLDTDGNEATGLEGAELWVRASVGSRFHGNSFRGEGDTPALEIRRTSWSDVVDLQLPGGGIDKRWRHQHDPLPPPTVDGKKIAFSFPINRIRAKGARYGSVVGIRTVVETSCSEQPLLVSTICNDEGIPIEVDGDDAEWSQARVTRDRDGELHDAATFLDLTALRVEHHGQKLFVSLSLAAAGFADDSAQDVGMDRRDAVHICVQPLFPRYQSQCQVSLEWGKPTQSGTVGAEGLAWKARVRDKTIEFELDRRPGQTLFRVFAWSDLHRFDTVGMGEFLHLDWAKRP